MTLRYADPNKEGFWGAMMPGGRTEGAVRRGAETGTGGVDEFQMVIDVCNGTAWGTVAKYLTRTRAHLVLVQEHHLPLHMIAAASQWALGKGWRTIWAPAEEGDGGWRAGVCICARDPVAISAPRKGGSIVSQARVVAALAEAPGCRPTTVYSVYLKDGEGLSRRNLNVLAELGQHVRLQGEGSPFVIGGDMQMAPQAISAAGMANKLHATIVASGCKRGTCRTSTSRSEIDYYFVEQGLARGIQAVEAVEGTCIRTHVPVRLKFHPRLTSAKALVIRKPPPLKVERLFGPLPPTPSWTRLRTWAEELAERVRRDDCDYDSTMEELECLYEEWADVAEVEIAGVTGDKIVKGGLRGRRPNMVWRSVVPERAIRPEGGTPEALRWLAMLAHELRDVGGVLPRGGWGIDERGGEARDADGDEAEATGTSGRRYVERWDRLENMNKVLDIMVDADDPPEAIAHVLDHTRQAEGGSEELAGVVKELLGTANELMMMLNGEGCRCQEDDSDGLTAEEIDAWDTRLGDLELKINELAAGAEKESRRREKAEWEDWVRCNIDAGARNAHRFLRLPVEWQPTCTLAIDGVVTADPLKVLSGYAEKYIGLWTDDDDDGEYVQDINGWGNKCSLERPSPRELREASRSFKELTLVAYDGFHPRHYSMMSDEALEITGALMVVAEMMGALPPQLRLLAMPLIPKPRTGHRAVAAFVSFLPTLGQSAQTHIEKWEEEHDRPYLAAGKDRSPSDVVWRQAARAEKEVEGDRERGAAGGLLWDMSTFFERLNRRKLRRRLVALDFPMPLARLAMAAYSGPRVLTMTGALSQPIYSWRGVAAGCGLAVAFTRAYYIPPFDHMMMDLRTTFGRTLDFDAYFDDVVLTGTGTEKEVEYALGEGHIILADVIEKELDCAIEVGKAAVVASSRGLATRLIKRIGRRAGPRRTTAVNLGIDYAPGRKRSAQGGESKRAIRFRGLGRKMARFRKLCKVVGGKASKVFVAGPLPYAVYGSVVNGMTDAEMNKLRRAMATAWSPRARGRSLRMLTLLNRAPTHTAENGAALQYCREVWRASLLGGAEPKHGEMTLQELGEAWHAINGKELVDGTTGKRRWNEARGPVAIAVLTFHRLGWHMKGPFVVVNDFGEDIALTANSPALMAHMMHEATMRELERQIGAKLHADGHTVFENKRACLDQVRSRLKGDSKMTNAEKAAYRSVLCDAIMTCSKACQSGYLVDDVCAKCGKRGDTVFHRVWTCEDAEVAAARNRVAPAWLQEEAKRRGPKDALFTKGLFPNPADSWPRPNRDAELHMYAADDEEMRSVVPGDADAGTYEKLAKDMDEWRPDEDRLTTEFVARAVADTMEGRTFNDHSKIKLGGRLYIDGSCTQHVFHELRRAAAGLVVRQPQRAVEARYLLPVWSPLPQSPQTAEYIAAIAPLQCIASAAVLVSDCQNVVSDFGRGAVAMMTAKRKYAGLLKHIWAIKERGSIEICKTKAHRAVGSLEPGLDREDAIGNAAADRAAKEAVRLHPRPSPAQEQELESNCKRASLIIRTIGATLSTFQPMPKERMLRRPIAKEGAAVDGDGGHQWTYLHGMWRCRRCRRCAVGDRLEARAAHERCRGLSDRHTMKSMADKGHDVVYTGGEMPITFCAKCGAFAWRRAYGMAAKCPRVPTPAGRQALARLRQGLVPWINAREAHLPRRRINTATGGIWCERAGAARAFRDKGHACSDGSGDDEAAGADDDRRDVQRETDEMRMESDIGGEAVHGKIGAFEQVQLEQHVYDVKEQGYEEEMSIDVFGHGGGLDNEDSVPNVTEELGDERTKRRRVAKVGVTEEEGHDEYRRRNNGNVLTNQGWVKEGARPNEVVDSVKGKGRGEEAGSEEQRVRARGTSNSASAACEGPGDVHPACITVVAAEPETGEAAAAVAAGGGVAPLSNGRTAQDDAQSDCGEATRPPDGCVAPSEDPRLVTRKPRGQVQELPMMKSSSASGWGPRKRHSGTTPQAKPRSLGAGPSKNGKTISAESGKPTQEEKVRRREGSEATAARYLVARGDDAATEACVRKKQPQGGWTRHKQDARKHGCEDSQVMEEIACRAETVSGNDEGGGGTRRSGGAGSAGDAQLRSGSGRSANDDGTTATDREGARDETSAVDVEGQSAAGGSGQRRRSSGTKGGEERRVREEGRDDHGRQQVLGQVLHGGDAGPRRVQGSHRRIHHDRVLGPHGGDHQGDQGAHGRGLREDRGWQKGRGSKEASSGHEEGARQVQEEEQETPIWKRRPAWMYLPHQCDVDQSDGGANKRRRLQQLEDDHAAKEDERIRIIEAGKRAGKAETGTGEVERAGDEGQIGVAEGPRGEEKKDTRVRACTIRGRETSPGATAGHLGGRDGDRRDATGHRKGSDGPGGNAAGGAHQPEIRGPPDGPGASSDRRRMGAQERLNAKNAHLRISLQLHAARVEKRAAEQQQGTGKPSAQERLLAIRRRVAERVKSGHEGGAPSREDDGQSKHLDGKGGDWESAEDVARRRRAGDDANACEKAEAQASAEACSRVGVAMEPVDAHARRGEAEENGLQAAAAAGLETSSGRTVKSGVMGGGGEVSAPADSTSRRNELRQQIHSVQGGGGIHAPACMEVDGVGERLRQGASSDAAHEASRVAWHGIEHVARGPR